MREETCEGESSLRQIKIASKSHLQPDQRAALARRLWHGRIPHLAILGLVLLLMCGGLLATQFREEYNSDQVAGIVAMQNWRLGDPSTAWLPPDTFLLKVPLYLLAQALLPNSPTAMFVIALLAGVVTFGGFFVAYRWLNGRALQAADYLPLVLLASLGPDLYYTLREPNTRNLEIGLAFLGMAVVVRAVARRPLVPSDARDYLLAGGVVIGVGLFIFNDPFFLYALIAPFALALMAWSLTRGQRRQAVWVGGMLGGALAASQGWRALFGWLHVSSAATQVRVVGLDQVGYHAWLALTGLLRMGNVPYAGHPFLDLQSVGALVNGGLLLLTLAAPGILWATRRRLEWWQWFLLAQPYYFFAVFILNGQVADAGSTRYFVLEPFFEALVLCLLISGIARTHWRQVARGAIVLACLLNVAATLGMLSAGDQRVNAHHEAVVRAVARTGLTKGYADYWSADINTYLAGNAIQFIPARCAPNGMRLYRWNMDDRVLALPATRTFYLVDRASQPAGACTIEQVERALGMPAETVAIDPQARLLIYDGDITARLLH